jgi:hypothetical protein
LITCDEHAPYEPSIEQAYAVEVRQPDGSTRKEMPKDLCYATVRKTRQAAVSLTLSRRWFSARSASG